MSEDLQIDAIAATEDCWNVLEPGTTGYAIKQMSAYEPKPLTWLWPGRVPKGKITVFAGAPGVGKGLATCSVIAIATTGREYPDEAIGEHEPMDVLMMSSEDDIEDTIVPRLMAAEADLNRIYDIKITVVEKDATKSERELAFDTDFKLLQKMLTEHPAVQLVIIDPITNYLGKIKSNDEQDVRRLLTPLSIYAKESGITFILVAHFNKRSDVSALHKIMGAVAMTGVARAAWMFAEVPPGEDGIPTDKYHMLQGKMNVGKKQKGLEYTITSKQVLPPPADTVGLLVWGTATDVTAEKAFNSTPAGDENDKVKKAQEFMTELLKNGERLSTEVFKLAACKGFSQATVRRAKYESSTIVHHRKNDRSWWSLESADMPHDNSSHLLPEQF